MSDIQVFLAISNDRTVISFTLYSDNEISYEKLAEALQQHVDLLKQSQPTQ